MVLINKQFLKWLQKELPKLVEAGIISDYQAESIWHYYFVQWQAKRKALFRYCLIWLGIVIFCCVGFWVLLRH